jgi:hypothetical protein
MLKSNHIKKLIFIILPLLLSLLFSANSMTSELPSLSLRVASEAIYQGVSETNGQSMIAINSEYALTSRFIVGVQFQEVIATSNIPRSRNFSTYIGYDKVIAENWLISTYMMHRDFPRAKINWDYNQISTRVSNSHGLSFDISYAPNYYSASVKGIGATAQYVKAVSKNWYWRAQLGNFNIPSLLSYQHAEVTAGLRVNNINIELSYHWVSDTELQTRVGNIQSPNALLSFSYAAF